MIPRCAGPTWPRTATTWPGATRRPAPPGSIRSRPARRARAGCPTGSSACTRWSRTSLPCRGPTRWAGRGRRQPAPGGTRALVSVPGPGERGHCCRRRRVTAPAGVPPARPSVSGPGAGEPPLAPRPGEPPGRAERRVSLRASGPAHHEGGQEMRVAAIDCGTNSLRLLVADVDPAAGTLTDVDRRMEIVRLGQGVDATGRLAPAALARTMGALRSYAELVAAAGATAVRMVATSATRDAANAADFVAGVRGVLGVGPEVLSGDEEALLSFTGATTELAAAARPGAAAGP